MNRLVFILTIVVLILFSGHRNVFGQELETVKINEDEEFQMIAGFGASLAYYEGWLTAHPNRNEIYDVIFNELSLDILRFRNAHGYDEGMMERVKEFNQAAENSLRYPIDILVTSWGPPAYLKSNNDRKNGGTLRFEVKDGNVEFDYAGFAQWWDESLDAYSANGIFPKYISIQNEPDFEATWESCLLRPAEIINSTDTIAGYNKALDAVYDTLMKRENTPLFVGPECVGIGYNAVENYINPLDLTKLHAIAHHLYHGAESGTVENDPFTSSNYKKVGDFHPEVPHFQTEYSRAGWFTLAGMIFQSLAAENVAAFLYWDLIWSEGGLVNLHFPWDRSRWENTKGYNRTKDYYVFKHYSRFIHPGWKRIGTTSTGEMLKTASFISSTGDSATFVAINRSETDSLRVRIEIPGYQLNEAFAYSTTEESNFTETDYLTDTVLIVPPKSINTVDMRLKAINTGLNENNLSAQPFFKVENFPNPFSSSTKIRFSTSVEAAFYLEVFTITGQPIIAEEMGYYSAGTHDYTFNGDDLQSGIYVYRIRSSTGKSGLGKMLVE